MLVHINEFLSSGSHSEKESAEKSVQTLQNELQLLQLDRERLHQMAMAAQRAQDHERVEREMVAEERDRAKAVCERV